MLSPEYVIERIGAIAGPDAVYTAGVGPAPDVGRPVHPIREAAVLDQLRRPGTMGFAVPAAMGAKLGLPDTTVWCIDGDGCFQMTNQELATCAIEGIPIKVAIINNGNLGMVRQWQNLFYSQRYSNTDLGTHKHRIPDFKLLAEAMGCVGLRCETRDKVDEVINQAMAINDQPVVIDFVVGADAQSGDGRGRQEQRRGQDRTRIRRCSTTTTPPSMPRGRADEQAHPSSVLVENKPGCSPVAGLFSRGASTSSRWRRAHRGDRGFPDDDRGGGRRSYGSSIRTARPACPTCRWPRR